MLTSAQILILLEHLKWEPVWEDRRMVLCEKRGIGYSENHTIAKIEAILSIMGEMAVRREKVDA